MSSRRNIAESSKRGTTDGTVQFKKKADDHPIAAAQGTLLAVVLSLPVWGVIFWIARRL